MIGKFGKNSLQIIKKEVNVHAVIKGYVDAFNYACSEKSILYSQKLNEKLMFFFDSTFVKNVINSILINWEDAQDFQIDYFIN